MGRLIELLGLLMAGRESGDGTWAGRWPREGPREGECDREFPGTEDKVDERPCAETGEVPRKELL